MRYSRGFTGGVHVWCPRCRPQMGDGWILCPDGYIIISLCHRQHGSIKRRAERDRIFFPEYVQRCPIWMDTRGLPIVDSWHRCRSRELLGPPLCHRLAIDWCPSDTTEPGRTFISSRSRSFCQHSCNYLDTQQQYVGWELLIYIYTTEHLSIGGTANRFILLEYCAIVSIGVDNFELYIDDRDETFSFLPSRRIKSVVYWIEMHRARGFVLVGYSRDTIFSLLDVNFGRRDPNLWYLPLRKPMICGCRDHLDDAYLPCCSRCCYEASR